MGNASPEMHIFKKTLNDSTWFKLEKEKIFFIIYMAFYVRSNYRP
jgi:hypothetical protein